MEIAHVVPTSLIDYPDRVAAVLFTAGCDFRCPFCHNAELVLPERVKELKLISLEEVLETLAARKGFLDGLVITGGEPTIQPDLREFITEVKGLGFLVKLDTNGSRPEVLEELLEEWLLDYVAMDVKAPRARYSELTGVPVDSGAIARSIALVRARAPNYEFRTTIAPTLTRGDIEAIAREIAGVKRYVLQPFVVPAGKSLVDPTWEKKPILSEAELHATWQGIAGNFSAGGVR
jgi:pyruvate formate lyase activating enzyme